MKRATVDNDPIVCENLSKEQREVSSQAQESWTTMHFGAAVILLQSLSLLLPYALAIFYLEPGKVDFKLKYAGCNGAIGKASNYTTVRSNATKVSDICGDLSLQIEQNSGNVSGLLGHFALNAFISTKEDAVTSQDIGTAGSISPSSINVYSDKYPAANLTRGSLTIPMKDIPLSLPNATCGEMYLISSFKYFANGTENATWGSFAYASLPFQVQCDEEADLEVFLEKKNSTGPEPKMYTLVPNVPIAKQIPGLNVMLRINSGSSLKSRTPASVLQVWVYLRANTNEANSTATSLDYQVGDSVIHTDYRLLQLNSTAYGTEQMTRNRSVPIELASVSIGTTSTCGEAFVIVAVDPLRTVKDPQPSNNYIKIPVSVDCWASQELMGSRLGACSVIPDLGTAGRSAVTYTTNYLYGSAEIKAYTYQAEDRSFRKLTSRDLNSSQEVARYWQKVQMEANRLYAANKCPSDNTFPAQKEASVLESVHLILKSVLNGFISVQFQNSNQMEHQKKIAKIGQVVGSFVSAATSYDTTPALVVDSLIPALQYMHSLNFEYVGQLAINSSGKEDWHCAAAKGLQFFLQMNPMQTNYYGFQKILNKLLWSPESLEQKNWQLDSVLKAREIVIWILQQQMPRTFDDLPPEISASFTKSVVDLFGPVPCTEDNIRAALVQLSTVVENAKLKYSSSLPATTATPSAATTASVATTLAANGTTVLSTTKAPNTTAANGTLLPVTSTVAPAGTTPSVSSASSTAATVTVVTTTSVSTSLPNLTTTAGSGTTTSTVPSTQLFSSSSTVSGTSAATTLAANSTGQFNVTVTTLPTTTRPGAVTGGTVNSSLSGVTATPAANPTTVVPVRLGTTMGSSPATNRNASADLLMLDKLTVIGSLINAINRPDIVKRLTKVINKIQAIMALKSEWMLTEGASAEPDLKELCSYYAAAKLGSSLDASVPLWKSQNDAIYRGDLSAVTGRYYWTQIAICSCDGGAPQSPPHVPPGFKTPK